MKTAKVQDLGAPTAGRRRRWPWAAGLALVGLAAVVLFWFQPQKLWIDERVDEAVPTATGTRSPADAGGATSAPAPAPAPDAAPAPAPDAAAPAPDAAPAVPTGPTDLAGGRFVSLDHGTTGTLRVLDLGDGARTVRLEGLDTDNGPDLYLYLSTNPASGPEQAFDDHYVSLGRLKGNVGDQNYDLPAGTDLSPFKSVVIWCDRFNSAFGAADITAH